MDVRIGDIIEFEIGCHARGPYRRHQYLSRRLHEREERTVRGQIIFIDNDESVAVELKNAPPGMGHTCNDHIPSGNGWWLFYNKVDCRNVTTSQTEDGHDGYLDVLLAQKIYEWERR